MDGGENPNLLTSNGESAHQSPENILLEGRFQQSVEAIRNYILNIMTLLDAFLPHYQELAAASGFLSLRTVEGMKAAHAARGNIETLAEKQRQIAAEMELLNLTIRMMISSDSASDLWLRRGVSMFR